MAITVLGGKRMNELNPFLGPAGADHYYFRYSWTPAITVQSTQASPSWTIRTSAGPAASLLRSHSGNHMVMNRPSAPDAVEISDGHDTVTVWFVSATLQANRTGHINTPANPNWAAVQQYFREHYGSSSYDFLQLGPVQFHSQGQSMDDSFDGTRYGDAIELVGQVQPAFIQSRVRVPFYILRRILGGFIGGVDSTGHNLPNNRGPRTVLPSAGSNDTSLRQTGVLNSSGQLFDYDLPGSVMTGLNHVGDQHTYSVHFEQIVVIGHITLGNPWPVSTSMGLGVSDAVQWRTNLRVRCTHAATATDGHVGIEIT